MSRARAKQVYRHAGLTFPSDPPNALTSSLAHSLTMVRNVPLRRCTGRKLAAAHRRGDYWGGRIREGAACGISEGGRGEGPCALTCTYQTCARPFPTLPLCAIRASCVAPVLPLRCGGVPTRSVTYELTSVLCSRHVQKGNLPLHIAAMHPGKELVVPLLLGEYQEGHMEKNAVRCRGAAQRTLPLSSHSKSSHILEPPTHASNSIARHTRLRCRMGSCHMIWPWKGNTSIALCSSLRPLGTRASNHYTRW